MKILSRSLEKIRLIRELSAVGYEQSVESCQPSVLNGHLPTKYPLSPKTYTRISLLLFILVFVSCSAALAQDVDVHSTPAAQAETEITPLKIGDKIPDELWEMYFPVVSANSDQVQYLSLGDFKDKLIILDFWATWCGSCIASMPTLNQLQRQFQDDLILLPVTYESKEVVMKFLENSKSSIIKSLKSVFLSVVDDSYLRAMFEFRSIPHIIVINNNTVVASSEALQINKDNIQELINGQNSYIPPKRFGELDKPMLKLAFEDVKTYKPALYSTITGYTDGFINASRHKVDSINGIQRFYKTSLSIVHLYSVTSQFGGLAVNLKRRILEVKDPSKYTNFTKADGSKTTTDINWKRANTYNYESILPLSFSVSDINKRFKDDLDFYFGLYARIEKRKIPVLILKNIKIDEKTSFSEKIINQLNYYVKDAPFIVNEAILNGDVEMDFAEKDYDLLAIQQFLEKHNLQLIEGEKEMEMFVLTENDYYKPYSSSLSISPYGYIFQQDTPEIQFKL